MCVRQIAAALRMSQPTASHHLGTLREAGLVERRRKGKWTFYRLATQTFWIASTQLVGGT